MTGLLSRPFLLDLTERALSTAAQAFLAAYVVSGVRAAAWTAAGAAGLAAVKALAKGAPPVKRKRRRRRKTPTQR